MKTEKNEEENNGYSSTVENKQTTVTMGQFYHTVLCYKINLNQSRKQHQSESKWLPAERKTV